MRTSTAQFDLMVTFMEQHGDLTKPSFNARGRISSLRHWEELTALLNSDGTGDTKTTEKWKKVWSDFKNNSKKKAARLHRAATATGGGPANLNKLSDLEQRVLSLIGVQVATGLAVEEAGLSQAIQANEEELILTLPPSSTPNNTNLEQLEIVDCSQLSNEAGPSAQSRIAPTQPSPEVRPLGSPFPYRNLVVESSQPWNEPGPSSRTHIAPPHPSPEARPVSSPIAYMDVVVDNTTPTQRQSPSQIHVVRPALAGQTPPRRGRPSRNRRSPRRLVRPAHTEQAAQHFLQAEEEWRKFKQEQHRDYMDLRREQNRIRRMELQAQREWQAIGIRALEMIDKLVTKYCRD